MLFSILKKISFKGRIDIIDYAHFASMGNAVDFGNLTAGRYAHTSTASPTRGLALGGKTPGTTATIDYFEIAYRYYLIKIITSNMKFSSGSKMGK